MYDFINGVITFVSSILTNINNSFRASSQTLANQYGEFLTSKILDGTLISSPLTWYQLFQFLVPTILITFFIIFVCKFIFKLIGMVKIW